MNAEIPYSRINSDWVKVLTSLIIALLVTTWLPQHADARENLRLWPMAEEVALTRQQDSVALALRLLPHQLRIPRKQALIMEPWLISTDGRDSICLPTVGLYGRSVYYHVARGGFNPFQDADDLFIRARNLPDSIAYAAQAPWMPWMQQGVDIHLHYYLVDGCSQILSELSQQQAIRPTTLEPDGLPDGNPALITPRRATTPAAPQTAAIQATAQPQQPKALKKGGKAYVDFIVNRIDLVPTLHDNPRELQKIRSTLDSLFADPTAVITRFTVTGYASPEGSYENNIRLASGRSETLSQYISDQWGVPRDIISSTFVPEDWVGFRRYVEQKAWPATPEMLRIMSAESNPDRRLAIIQQRFPREYADIKKNALPYLRHSDYEIEYEHIDSTEQRISPYRNRTADIPATAARATTAPRTGSAGRSGAQDTLAIPRAPFTPAALQSFKTYRSLFALKTNLLFDAALAPNVEVEFPLGRDSRWSIMVEDWFPWFRVSHNEKGDASPYYRSDQRPTRHSYEVWTLGAELRYWFTPRCRAAKPALSGTFLGIYGAGGKYDVEWKSEGYQGEFTSFGITLGHSWVLSRHWNLELSASGGYVGGPQRHYKAEFDDARLIFRNRDRLRYIGPTKLKLSLAWIIGHKAKKGGDK